MSAAIKVQGKVEKRIASKIKGGWSQKNDWDCAAVKLGAGNAPRLGELVGPTHGVTSARRAVDKEDAAGVRSWEEGWDSSFR